MKKEKREQQQAGAAGDPTPALATEVDLGPDCATLFSLANACVHDLIWQWIPDDDRLIWYGDIARALGVDAETTASWGALRQRIHDDDIDGFDRQSEWIGSLPQTYERAYRIRHADGSDRHWVERGRYWPERRCFVGAVRDQTELRVTEASYLDALNEKGSRYRTLVENIPGAAYRCELDEHWTMRYISRGIEKLTGYPAEDFIDNRVRSFGSIIHPDDRERVDREVHRAIELRGPFMLEYRVLDAEGSTIWFWERGVGICDDNGEVSHLEGVFYDLTERKRSEERLRRSEERFDLAMQGANDGLYDWDLVSNEIYYSPRWKSMLGYRDDELPNQFSSWEDLVDEQDRQKSWEMLTDYIAGRRDNFHLEFRMRHKAGHWVDILSRARLVRNPDGEAVRVVGTHVDISERMRKEAENARLQRQLEQAHKMEALGLLTGGIAHDFNNMLGIMLGFTSLAQVPSVTAEKRAGYLLQVERAALRAKKLVTQMLSFSRGGSESSKPVALLPMVHEDLELIGSMLPASIRIETSLAEDLPLVVMNPVQLNQILMNLCINARDAMQGDGVLSIALDRRCVAGEICSACYEHVRGEWVELSVADTGSGIAPEVKDRIFDPFFSTKSFGEGSGMGLSVVHGILRGHNGHILVESRPEGGSRFRVLLPAVAGAIEPARVAEQASGSPHSGMGERLMVVDDEADLVDYLDELLKMNGYTVEALVDSREALRRFESHPDDYGLLITDQTMPFLSGLELIRQIRELRPSLPAILCSGYSETVAGNDMESFGIEYLGKPVDAALLLRRIRELLPRPER
jgi:PAS domain S-box-containing protein